MKYCSECGAPTEKKIPEGDSRLRDVCSECKTIHYSNPNIVAGCLVTSNTAVLLCRRAIEPRVGYWTLPAGYMENNETTLEAAERETWEEAEARTDSASLYQIFNVPDISQVHFFYRGELEGPYGVGIESLETKLFEEDEIPWDQIAFPTVKRLLARFFADRNDLSPMEMTLRRPSGK